MSYSASDYICPLNFSVQEMTNIGCLVTDEESGYMQFSSISSSNFPIHVPFVSKLLTTAVFWPLSSAASILSIYTFESFFLSIRLSLVTHLLYPLMDKNRTSLSDIHKVILFIVRV